MRGSIKAAVRRDFFGLLLPVMALMGASVHGHLPQHYVNTTGNVVVDSTQYAANATVTIKGPFLVWLCLHRMGHC